MISYKWLGALLAAAATAQAEVVADFGGDFQANSPATGWSYQWNSGGPLIDAFFTAQIGNFAPLVYDTTGVGGYQTQNNGAWPDAAPGSYSRVTSTQVFPGQTASQDAGGIQRFVILAYTFDNAEVAAFGSDLLFHTYDFDVPGTLSDPIDVFVFKNTAPIFFNPAGFGPPGFSDADFGQDYSFGTVSGGDTLYIALGARSDYQGDALGVAFTLALVPEPGVLGLACLAPLALRRRRA